MAPPVLCPPRSSLIGDNLTWTLQSHGASRADGQPGHVYDPEHEPGHGRRRGQCPDQWRRIRRARRRLLLTPAQLAAIANFQFPGPTAIQLSAASVNEKQAAGTLVGTLSSTDTQSGATFTYSLPQNAAYPDNASFSIDATATCGPRRS